MHVFWFLLQLYPHIVHYGKVDSASNSLKFSLSRPCNTGEQCCLSYGNFSSSHLITFYGFSPQGDNRYDVIPIGIYYFLTFALVTFLYRSIDIFPDVWEIQGVSPIWNYITFFLKSHSSLFWQMHMFLLTYLSMYRIIVMVQILMLARLIVLRIAPCLTGPPTWCGVLGSQKITIFSIMVYHLHY